MERGSAVELKINIPDREFWFLSEMAEKFGVKVSDMVRFTAARAKDVTQDDIIQALWRAGLPDADIADRMGLVNNTVKDRRRYMGLPANKRPANWGREKTAA
jgi:uncharacterized protein YjcR